MNLSNNLLLQFAASCNYSNHDDLAIRNGELVLSPEGNVNKASINDIVAKALEIYEKAAPDQKAVSREALVIIKEHLEDHEGSLLTKIQRLFITINPEVKEAIQKLDQALSLNNRTEPLSTSNQEQLFLLKFLSTLPKILSVSNAPSADNTIVFRWKDGTVEEKHVNEWLVIEKIAKKIYNSTQIQDLPPEQRYGKFQELMTEVYKGSHFLFEEDHDDSFVEQMSPEAIIRASSHYEKGRKVKGWENGEPIYSGDDHASLLSADTHHYGLSGKHIRHILFNSLDAKEGIDGKIVPAKTAHQVDKLLASQKLNIDTKPETRRFVALQSESSPDCEGNDWLGPLQGRGALFYTHRLAGFITYRFLKLIGVENANVGAYGFGRTDLNPIVITKAKA